MKILHVCESIIGGTGSYLAELIPHQAERYGSENIALLIPGTQLAFLEPEIEKAGVVIIPFSRASRLRGTFCLAAGYLKALRRFRPDVVHAHSSIAGLVVRLLRLHRGAKIVFCPHGWSVDMIGARKVRYIATVVEKLLAKFGDQVIVISRHEHQRGLELGIRPEKLALVTNGITPAVPNVAPADWSTDRLKVLYAGRFDRQKGVDVLMRAVAGLDECISLRLVGGSAVDNSVMLPDPLPGFISLMGWLDRTAVAAQMKSCDVLVVPSRWEGFGLVAIEAMRLGKPVAAADVGGLREILDGGRFGYLLPSEDDAALRAFLLNADRTELEEMGRKGYQRFLSLYTSEHMVRAIDEIYAGTENRQPSPS